MPNDGGRTGAVGVRTAANVVLRQWQSGEVYLSRKYRVVTAEEAVQFVGSGDAVYLSSAGSVPKKLVDALCTRARLGGLSNVTLRHIHTAETITRGRSMRGFSVRNPFSSAAMSAGRCTPDMPTTCRFPCMKYRCCSAEAFYRWMSR